jgi:hypothetical protein
MNPMLLEKSMYLNPAFEAKHLANGGLRKPLCAIAFQRQCLKRNTPGTSARRNVYRKQMQRGSERACLGRALSDSNSSINYFHFSVFSAIWGICFSLKGNPNGSKNIAFCHTFGTGPARMAMACADFGRRASIESFLFLLRGNVERFGGASDGHTQVCFGF